MLAVFRTELAKQLRRPRTYVALGAMVVIPIVITVALKASPPESPRNGRESFFFFATQTGLFVPVAALSAMSRLLLVFAVAVFAGDAIASEASLGTLRYLLLRPISRRRLLAAKLANAAVFSIAATALITLSGLAVGTIAFGWRPLPPIAAFFALDQSSGLLVAHLGIATLYVAWSLAAVVTFGFMISTMTDTAAGAIGGAVGLSILSQILDAIEPLGSVRTVLPTHYLDAWHSLFTGIDATDRMAHGALLQIPYALAFCSVAWWWFRRKDILS
jgi:ABC-2 type transport system permease protein